MMSRYFFICCLLLSQTALAEEAQTISTSGAMLKMVLGLGVVLLVMFGMTWLAKRVLPHTGASNAVIQVVGGTNVGSRERVVVLEVADRWLVVGVGSNGQVNPIADLAPGQLPDLGETPVNHTEQGDRFKQWLNKAMRKSESS